LTSSPSPEPAGNAAPSPLPALAADAALVDCRSHLTAVREGLRQRYLAAAPIGELVHGLAQAVDQILAQAWRHSALPHEGVALVAVGGYGRGELHPHSDIDIAIVLKAAPDEKLRQQLERFITLLWDLGLDIGHSTRTLEECRREAAADVTVATNLMEARLLQGDGALYAQMREITGPAQIWPTPVFFAAKRDEQAARYRRFHDTAQNLEPNVKEGPGGLRDIQVIGWVAKRHFGAETLHDLVDRGFLTEEEYHTLNAGQEFLWRIRYGLHLHTGRREDRLLFDHQRLIAEQSGFRDPKGGHRGIEQFMKLFYRTLLELRRLNEMLLGLFEEAILHAAHPAEIIPLNNRFQIRNGFIETCHDQVFQRYPFALLEIFLFMQQRPEIQGVRASTIRLIRNHRHLIDEPFRNDLRNRSLFMEIIRQPRRLGHELQRMHRYGVLEAYLPVFGAIVGLMQFDLFHVYTVDEHTLFVVRNLRRLAFPDENDDLPLCREVMAQLPKPELLYLGGLFHDICKGRGGDHSELGEHEALAFCKHHGLSAFDGKLVAWLVRQHLLMSKTAQRMDISDPEVIHNFAGILGDKMHLDYLYLLTVADIRSTNPTLWTSWKDSLLRELYRKTLHALRRGLENPIQRRERIAETQGEAMALLCNQQLDQAAVRRLWQAMGEDYFLRHLPEEISWHARAILAHSDTTGPLVHIRPETRRGGSEIFIYTRDQDGLFSISTQTLDALGLNIQEARILTSANGYTLDTYTVLEADSGETIRSEQRGDEIITALKRNIKDHVEGPMPARRSSRKLRNFTIPTEVLFSDDPVNARTMMEVITTDRPGVLARIAQAMRFCGVRLQNARIATFGERVEDIFYLTGMDNLPLKNEVKLECLRHSVTTALAND
jgi:[protein-PII] uridylyltransferase